MIGHIYEIYLIDDPINSYIGGTLQTIENRFKKHKANYQCKTNNSHKLVEMFDRFGMDKFNVRELAHYEVIDTSHLRAYEQLWINKIHPSFNLYSAFIPLPKETQKQQTTEWRLLHPTYWKNKASKWRLEHPTYDQKYYQEHKDILKSQYRQKRLSHLYKQLETATDEEKIKINRKINKVLKN